MFKTYNTLPQIKCIFASYSDYYNKTMPSTIASGPIPQHYNSHSSTGRMRIYRTPR